MRSPAPLVLVLAMVVGACGRAPAPGGGDGGGPERLTLGQAVDRARAFAADRGLPDAVLARVERGEAFGRDGRAVWSIALCDPSTGQEVLASAGVASLGPAGGTCQPLPAWADSTEVASRNPDLWAFVDSFTGEEAKGVTVAIWVDHFMGPSPWYGHGDLAWVIEVAYPTGRDEAGRVVLEGRRFWAALESGMPVYDEGGRIYDQEGNVIPPS